MSEEFRANDAQNLLESTFSRAEETINDRSKLEELFQKLEEKLKSVPVAGTMLAEIPLLASMVRSWIKKEYPDVSKKTIIAVVGALIYFIAPRDIIPDKTPIIGKLDDIAVVAACLKYIEGDLNAYSEWRKANGLTMDFGGTFSADEE